MNSKSLRVVPSASSEAPKILIMSYNKKLYQWHKECEKTIQEYNIKTLRRQEVAIAAAAASAVLIWANKIPKKSGIIKKNEFG